MSEFRQDYLTEECVWIAIERGNRPQNYKNIKTLNIESDDTCPFCEKNLNMLPDVVFISEDKRVKIIPNLYPAVSEDSLNGFGKHEVLIDTPNHKEKLAFFSELDFFTVLKSIQMRVYFFSKSEKIKYVQVFKNDGEKAGASIYHSHWQIVALSIIPNKQRTIKNNFIKYKKEKGTCYLCDEIKKLEEYTIIQNNNFIAYIPYAYIYSYSVNITCKKHYSAIEDFDDIMIQELASIIKKTLKLLNIIIKDLNYNICFQNKVYEDSEENINHFYLQIIPRTANIAGFEFSTGCYINSVDPLVAVENFRRTLLEN